MLQPAGARRILAEVRPPSPLIIPLREIGIDLGLLPEPGKNAALSSAPWPARQHPIKRDAVQKGHDAACLHLPLTRRGEYRSSRCGAGEQPFGLAAADETDLRRERVDAAHVADPEQRPMRMSALLISKRLPERRAFLYQRVCHAITRCNERSSVRGRSGK